MNFLFGRGWVLEEEADDGTQGGGGATGGDGGDTDVDAGGDADTDAAGAAKDGAAASPEQGGAKKEEAPKDMKSAIDAALGYKKGPNGEALDPLTGKPKVTPEKAGEKKAATPAAGEDKHANGTPKKNEKGEPLDDKGQVIKPKAKTAAELDLKPDQLKLLKPETQARFREVIGALKEREATIGTLTTENKGLKEARDAILGVMEETHTTHEQLGVYLEFNALLHSQNPKDLERALGFVEQQRAALYKALGREPQGGDLDLLAEFPDLQQKVTDGQITREDALELANGRREKAARDSAAQRQQQQQRQQTQTEAQRKQIADAAVAEITAWTTDLAKTDLDYKAKEDKLLAKLDGVLKSYTPDKWLPTLKLLYEGIEIQKAAAPAGAPKGPLRPSGARPGAKAPNSMLDAINQGLGYAGAEKG